jgi:hypothetical protein
MSLKTALELLESAHKTFKIGDGPLNKGKHALTMSENRLVLTINTGSEFKDFIFDDNDLEKEPQELINEISDLLQGQSVDLGKMN